MLAVPTNPSGTEKTVAASLPVRNHVSLPEVALNTSCDMDVTQAGEIRLPHQGICEPRRDFFQGDLALPQ